MTVETVEYRVRRGDTVQSVVQAAGFPRRDWRRIYDAAYNRAFKRLRPDPDHIEPGDRMFLPRFNPAQIADIVVRIQRAEEKFQAMTRDSRRFEAELQEVEDGIQAAQDLSARDLQRRVAAVMSRAQVLDDLADSANDECDGVYTCLGAGAAANRFQREARQLRAEARNLQRNVKKSERDGLRAVEKLREMLRRLEAGQSQTAGRIQRLRTLYRRAAQNPY